MVPREMEWFVSLQVGVRPDFGDSMSGYEDRVVGKLIEGVAVRRWGM